MNVLRYFHDYVAKISDGKDWTDWVHLNQLKKLQLRDPDLLLDTDEDSTPVIHDFIPKPKSEGAIPTKTEVATPPKPKSKPKKAPRKPPPSVPVRKSSRNSKPVQQFNISSTNTKSYAAVAKS